MHKFGLLCFLFPVLLMGQNVGFHPENQRAIVEKQGDITIRLRADGPTLHLVIQMRGRSENEVTLPQELVQVDEIDFVDSRSAVALGKVSGDVSEVVVLNLSALTIQDRFYCYSPMLSPSKRFVAFVKFFPAHFVEGVSDVYSLYDLQKSPTGNRKSLAPLNDVQNVGRVIYPADQENQNGDNIDRSESQIRLLVSGTFFWSSDSRRLAFADQYQNTTSLVVAIFPETETPLVLKTAEIKKSEVCLSGIDGCSFSVRSIQFSDQNHIKLTLRSSDLRYPVRSEIDLAM